MGDTLLKELVQDLMASQKTFPPLQKGLAAIFNNLVSVKIDDEKLKAKLDKHPRPGDIQGLQSPKVNQGQWKQS